MDGGAVRQINAGTDHYCGNFRRRVRELQLVFKAVLAELNMIGFDVN